MGRGLRGKENLMSTTTLSQRLATTLRVITLPIFPATATNAQCVAHLRNGNALAPAGQESAAQDIESLSGQLGSSESLDKERDDSEVTVLGLWKKIYFSEGALNDVGFAQFNAGGTE